MSPYSAKANTSSSVFVLPGPATPGTRKPTYPTLPMLMAPTKPSTSPTASSSRPMFPRQGEETHGLKILNKTYSICLILSLESTEN